MMGIHVGHRPVWLVRAAHCVGTPPATPETQRPNKTVVVKRSAALSVEGLRFAKRLGRFCAERCAEYARGNADLYSESSPHPTSQPPSRVGSLSIDNSINSLDIPLPSVTLPPSVASAHHRRSSSGDHDTLAPQLALAGLAEELDAAVADGRLAEDAWNPAFQCAVFTSTLPRAMQTASLVQTAAGRPHATPALNPVDRGTAYGLTEDQFERQHPDEFERWRSNMRHTRFPGGESYADLLQRIEPFLIELEQQTSPVLVVSHLSVLQMLSAYFTGLPLEEALNTSIPHHSILQIEPSAKADMWVQSLVPLTLADDEPDFDP